MSQNHVGKISVKSVYGEVSPMEKGDKDLPLMRVMGICAKAEHGESDKGPWTGFFGDFAAINMDTGEVYRSAKCFLPNVATIQLVVALENSNGPVEFAMDVYARHSANALKYEYFVKSLKDMNATDPLAGLLNSLPPLPALQDLTDMEEDEPAPVPARTVAKPATAKARK